MTTSEYSPRLMSRRSIDTGHAQSVIVHPFHPHHRSHAHPHPFPHSHPMWLPSFIHPHLLHRGSVHLHFRRLSCLRVHVHLPLGQMRSHRLACPHLLPVRNATSTIHHHLHLT